MVPIQQQFMGYGGSTTTKTQNSPRGLLMFFKFIIGFFAGVMLGLAFHVTNNLIELRRIDYVPQDCVWAHNQVEVIRQIVNEK